MNRGVPTPCTKPTDVASAETTAEWLLGMPPVVQNRLSRMLLAVRGRVRSSATIDFRICGVNQLQNAERNTGWESSRGISSTSGRVATGAQSHAASCYCHAND